MPSIFRSAAMLALAGVAVANPLIKRDDACLAAVTGKAALGDDSLRKEHCSSYFKTIVTPGAVTVTTTITDAPQPTTSNWNQWQKKDVTVCPNEVPNYASACDDNGYRSACKAWGVVGETTFTIPQTTTTKTIYLGNGAQCAASTVTNAGSTTTVTVGAGATVTVTAPTSVVTGSTTTVTYTGPSGSVYTQTYTIPGTAITGSATTVTYTFGGSTYTQTFTVPAATSTVTVTAGGVGINGTATSTVTATQFVTVTGPGSVSPTGGAPFQNSTSGLCLTSMAQATVFTNAFKNLLEFTNAGTQPGVNFPYNSNISATYLAVDFQDYSDSINWMSGRPLGSVTFASRAEFDQEQGSGQQPLIVTDHLTNFGCNHITWKWSAITATGGNVMGINHFILTPDLTQIAVNHAEFNDAAWIQSLTNLGAYYPQFSAINCVVPSLTGSSNSTSNSNGTASATITSTSTVAVTVTATSATSTET